MNLPAERTSFVGRRPGTLRSQGAVVGFPPGDLTGVGGSGETRLPLRAATDRRHFPDGAWFGDPALRIDGWRTTDRHVEKILVTLGFTSRAQIAAWAAEQQER
jgi:hypothetical protein